MFEERMQNDENTRNEKKKKEIEKKRKTTRIFGLRIRIFDTADHFTSHGLLYQELSCNDAT